ncbi:MAG: translational GTPase TypA [Phycisphaerae bacterium]|nr:translational GTPase TypA [Phycisphaerae bacterium]
MSVSRSIRNIAIIAHVDHGKTTLVDAILAQSGTIRESAAREDCILDSNPLERERGITILSKNCAVDWTYDDGETIRVNVIDTPGHADFGGEVERVLMMADGVLLLVDAAEGPMPQTRFVLGKALAIGLRPIVVVNKCDKADARCDQVVDEVFDLLVDLGADDEALDFPVLFASGRDGWAGPSHLDPESRTQGVRPLLEVIRDRIPAPLNDPAGTLQMRITSLDRNDFVGRIVIGRVTRGVIRAGDRVAICTESGHTHARIGRVLAFDGLGRREVDAVEAGDLCAIEGLEVAGIGDTIADPEMPEPLPRVSVDEPTLHMVFRINDGPFAGRDGKYVTTRQIRDRLDRELEANVALKVETGESADSFRVSGRGLLHLGILLEQMRREGYEVVVGRPEVVLRAIDGIKHEPWERVNVDAPPEAIGTAIEMIGSRGGEIQSMDTVGNRSRVEGVMPSRGLIGLRTRLLNASGGEAILHHTFEDWRPLGPMRRERGNGVMVSMETGRATPYSLLALSERALMFVEPGEDVYEGMVVGENSRDNDLDVNPAKAKAFSNVRESTKEATVVMKAPRKMTLEMALEYIAEDEAVEITPNAIRMRKLILREVDRKRMQRHRRQQAADAASR